MKISILNLIRKFKIDHSTKYEICAQSKQTRKLSKSIPIRDIQELELIHDEVCDSNRGSTRGESRYFVTFIDDFIKYCYIYLLKIKDELLNKFKVYKAEGENQQKKRIKVIRPDKGGEYISNELALFCKEHGIIHYVTAPYLNLVYG